MLASPAVGLGSEQPAFVDAFYRSGALVFGGGHVVLPLLEETAVSGLGKPEGFLAGYGATQAMPGPMFSFAGYLGFVSQGLMTGIWGASVATIALFAPGFLLVAGLLPHWSHWLRIHGCPRLVGASAAVVGLLGAASMTPFGHRRFSSPLI